MKGILVTEALGWTGQNDCGGCHEYVLEGTVYIPEIEVKLIRRFGLSYTGYSYEDLNHIKKCFGDKLIEIEVDGGLIKKIHEISKEISKKEVEIVEAEKRRTSAIAELSRSIPAIRAVKQISA